MTTSHVPILVEPIVSTLIEPFRRLPEDAPTHWIVDCTFGGGGHSGKFLEALANEPTLRRHKVLGLDQDPGAVERGRERFAREIAEGRLEIVHAHFSELEDVVPGKPMLGLMADLGFSSDQIESADRGLSFQLEGPLDMRMDPTRGVSCKDWIARATEAELEKVLREYGEERFSRQIARSVMTHRREEGPPKTTRELVQWVVHGIPSQHRHGRIHAATRTFQALRIVVNQEMEELEALLSRGISMLATGGRAAILSFHSLEDRRVKQTFKALSVGDEAQYQVLTKKPLEADEVEVRGNPRARSAKLRMIERLG